MGGPARILVRADSGLEIGTGHVMRCLTLGDALRIQGGDTIFVTREHRGHIIPAITDRGYRAFVLPVNSGAPYGAHPARPSHAHWLHEDWRNDAAATRAALMETDADWLVVDHYALDSSWQEAALLPGVRILVLDDLADRPHLAQMLLDQNAGRQVEDYSGLVPKDCELWVGASHALLRAEFTRLRPEALDRREALDRPQTLLVTLGGVDKDNATGRVMDALAQADAAAGMRITVVMGSSAPHFEAVLARAATMPMPTEVALGVSDMGLRMMHADLCIGAAGSTAWERCALGLPTLQVVLASNQLAAARSMAEQGVSMALPFPDRPDFTTALAKGLAYLSNSKAYHDMSTRSAALTDGAGAERLARHLLRIAHA